MPHNGARERQWLAAPGCQARSAEGVMLRRLSVASRDSGAESPVYGEEPSASADRDPVVSPPRADGNGRWAADGGQAVAGRYLAPETMIMSLAVRSALTASLRFRFRNVGRHATSR